MYLKTLSSEDKNIIFRRSLRASLDYQRGPCYIEVLSIPLLGYCPHPHGQSQAASLFSLHQVGREKRAWRSHIMALGERPGYGHTPSDFIPFQTTQSHGHTQTQWRLGKHKYCAFSVSGRKKVFLCPLWVTGLVWKLNGQSNRSAYKFHWIFTIRRAASQDNQHPKKWPAQEALTSFRQTINLWRHRGLG